jgi:hypothetical protein
MSLGLTAHHFGRNPSGATPTWHYGMHMVPCLRVKLSLPLAALVLFAAAPVLAQPDPAEPPPPVAEPSPVPLDEPAPSELESTAAEPAPAPVGAPPPASYPLEGEAPLPTATDPTSDIRRHDGFYLRIGLGIGALSLNRSTKNTSASTDVAYSGDSTIRGPAGVGEISIGGTVANGLVLCGSVLNHEHTGATLERDEGADVDLNTSLSFGLVGMGIHYFPDERGGWHFGGTLGLAYALADVSASRFERLGGVGIGASLAGGHDWWISDQWALGVLGRITAARLQGEATSGGATAEESDTAGAIAVMFSVLHH